MAVAADFKFEGNGQTVSPASVTSTGAGVSASATAMIAFMVVNATVAALGTVSATWNAVAMTAIGTGVDITGGASVWMFGLKSPASGNKVLSLSWTGGGNPQWYLGFATFTGSDTSGTGWNNAGSDTGNSATASSVVTTTSGDMAVVGHGDLDGAPTLTAGVQDWLDTALTANGGQAHLAASGASTTVTWTLAGGAWANLKVNVQQSGGGAAAPFPPWPRDSQPGVPLSPLLRM